MKAENPFRHWISHGKALLVSAFLFILLFNSAAKAEDLFDLEKDGEQTAQAIGGEAAKDLRQFRISVQKDAYSMTMKLCQGYRVATGLPMLPPGHESAGYSVAESTTAWGKILGEGALVTYSSLFGRKLVYNKIENWNNYELFLSMYTIFLVNSPGFFYAAQHCLNTVDQNDIFLFAYAIAMADVSANFISDAGVMTGLNFAGSAIAGTSIGQKLIAFSARWIANPYNRVVALLKKQIERVIPVRILIGSLIVPIAIDNVADRHREASEVEKAGNQLLADEISKPPLAPDEFQFQLRYKTIEHGFLLLQPILKDDKNQIAQENMRVFEEKELTPDKLELYHADQIRLEQIDETKRSEAQQNYLDLLKFMRPLLAAAQSPG
jgi:hypothetical protein